MQNAAVAVTKRQHDAMDKIARANAEVNRAILLRTKAVNLINETNDFVDDSARLPQHMEPKKAPEGRVKLDSIPGVKNITASGKRMRRLPTYYLKKEEEVMTGLDGDQYSALIKRIKMDDSSSTAAAMVKTETG